MTQRSGDIWSETAPPQCGQINFSQTKNVILSKLQIDHFAISPKQTIFFCSIRRLRKPIESNILLCVTCKLQYILFQDDKKNTHYIISSHGVKFRNGLTLLTFLKYILI